MSTISVSPYIGFNNKLKLIPDVGSTSVILNFSPIFVAGGSDAFLITICCRSQATTYASVMAFNTSGNIIVAPLFTNGTGITFASTSLEVTINYPAATALTYITIMAV